MDRGELRQLIQGCLVTVPTAFDDEMNVDLARMTDLTRWWMEQGLGTNTAPLKVTAAMGEGPDLGDDEWPHVLRTVVNAAGGDAVVMCALEDEEHAARHRGREAGAGPGGDRSADRPAVLPPLPAGRTMCGTSRTFRTRSTSAS